MFLVVGSFATSQLPATVSAVCDQCCIRSGGVCPQAGRTCCSGLTCSAPVGGGGTTCRSGGGGGGGGGGGPIEPIEQVQY